MKISYDPEVDILRVLFNTHAIEESDEDRPGVISLSTRGKAIQRLHRDEQLQLFLGEGLETVVYREIARAGILRLNDHRERSDLS